MNIEQLNLLKKRIDKFLGVYENLSARNKELILENDELKKKLELLENSSNGNALNIVQALEKENERLKSNNTEAKKKITRLLNQLESRSEKRIGVDS